MCEQCVETIRADMADDLAMFDQDLASYDTRIDAVLELIRTECGDRTRGPEALMFVAHRMADSSGCVEDPDADTITMHSGMYLFLVRALIRLSLAQEPTMAVPPC